MERKEALDLLKKYVKSEQLLKHCLAVEASMEAYAKKFNEDEKRWGLLGLLHDIDYEMYPEIHPLKSPEILSEQGFDDEFIKSILSHGIDTGIERDTLERKCLHAVDEMSGFIIAVALMRPTKLEGLKAKSVKKKMKDKAFAKAVDRDELLSSMEELNIEFNEHIDIIVNGLISNLERSKEDGAEFV